MLALCNGGEPNLYESLEHQQKQIRLLSFESKDRLSLKTFDIDDAPPYTALSYTWGEPRSEHSIWLNGHELTIRPHLRMALPDICTFVQDPDRVDYVFHWDPDKPHPYVACPPKIDLAKSTEALKYFWIDALCINQADIQERNHQVSLMRQIYLQARTLCIWLERDCETDLELIRTVTSTHRGMETAMGVKPGVKVKKSPYWKRLWTLQEHLLARDAVFLSGSAAVNYAKVEEVILWNWVEFLSEKPDISFPRSPMWAGGVALSYLLAFGFELICSDPRDCIYGLLGLVEWGACKEEERIDADYTLTCEQLLKKLKVIGIHPDNQPRLLVKLH